MLIFFPAGWQQCIHLWYPHKYDRETLTPCLLQEDFQAFTDFLKHGRAQK